MGGQEEDSQSTSSCCLRCEWERVRVFALLGAAGKAGEAKAGQRHSLVAAERGLIPGTAPTVSLGTDAWLRQPQAAVTAEGLENSAGWIRVIW